MPLSPEDRKAVVESLDISKAQCFDPDDREMIMADVDATHGSADAFNRKLRLQLLLEPLSYRVDLRRLLARAQETGTRWCFGAVRDWLGEGEGAASPRRLLCMCAGAGEGKSTASAALCSGLLPPGSIAAYHLCKYNDARRLDPVRIIKSLAFQLAAR
jgi:hypothetical protein